MTEQKNNNKGIGTPRYDRHTKLSELKREKINKKRREGERERERDTSYMFLITFLRAFENN
ncbi:hypothetical protein WN55_11381 [Dufourea novaeangliae]|uniref:Uncharacterized protein n=1 Tax=Dufourea novaeangliae TaxID=178035 RepID=A0A154PC72_DUFNO|nr:hypothetical protein WN55_11381 [Dufourea novaeangliae]